MSDIRSSTLMQLQSPIVAFYKEYKTDPFVRFLLDIWNEKVTKELQVHWQ